MTLREQFGDIDVYLFDQLLRGRIGPGMRVLDAGCGHGRNLVYLLRSGIEVFAVDSDPNAVHAVRALASSLRRERAVGSEAVRGVGSEQVRGVGSLDPTDEYLRTHVKVESIEGMTIPPSSMDAVICSAVLHFARDDGHFEAMVRRMWQTLVPGGLMFCRLASITGVESRVRALGSGRYLLPDGSERYLVSESRLVELTQALGGTLVDPIKSTIVQDMRCMATWVLRAAR